MLQASLSEDVIRAIVRYNMRLLIFRFPEGGKSCLPPFVLLVAVRCRKMQLFARRAALLSPNRMKELQYHHNLPQIMEETRTRTTPTLRLHLRLRLLSQPAGNLLLSWE